MKRILSIILILILSLGVLSACEWGTKPTTDTTDYKVETVRDYVRSMYTDLLDNNKTKKDFKLITSLMMYGTRYTVEWTVDDSAIAVVPSADGLEVTIDVPETVEEDINYKLTGTVLAPNGSSAAIEFDLVVPAPEAKPFLDLMGKTNLVSASGEQNVFAANGVTFTNDKASSTSALTVQDTYAQRAYANSTIKIEYKGMRKIVITCDDYSPDGTKNYYSGMDGMTVEGAVIVRKDAVITIYFPNGPVDVFQSTNLASQMRIKSIEVFTTWTAEDDAIANGNGGNGGETSEYQAPAADTAFKLFLEVGGVNYYFMVGALDQDRYLLTTTDVAASTDIYFEVVDGGYNIYYMDGTTKTYINAVGYKKSNGYLGAHFAIGTEPNCVWTFNDVLGILEVNAEYEDLEPDTFFAGTYGSYTTISLSGSYYKAQISSGTQFPARLVLSSEAGNGGSVHTHEFVNGVCGCGEKDPNYVPPQADANALTSLKTGDKVYIVAPAYNMALSATKVATYYNKGVDVSGGFSGLTDAEIWEVTVNADGSYTFTSLTGKVLALAADYASLNEDGENKSWTLEVKSEGIFYVKNTVRGNYLEWYASKSNWSTYATSSLSDLFEISFYAYELAEGGETPAPHEHTFVEGKCECGEEDPNYVPPVEGGDEVVSGGSADFDSLLPGSNGSSAYTGTHTTTNGWVVTNSAVQAGGATVMNPQFPVIGADNTSKAVCLNGKTSAPGKLTSPTLNGGISKLTMDYTKMFTDTKLSVTVTITDLTTGAVYTQVVEREEAKDTKYVVWTFEWVLDTAIEGDFTIEIVNNCPTAADSNKDRITILDLSWTK